MNSMIVLVGATAVGKTAIAVQLAKDIQSEIISCDSRQFFRELNIGTAKPTPVEMDGIIHHFINNLSIHDYYSAGRFETEVLNFLQSYYKDHIHVIMAGGSGLYINAICNGISQMPQPDDLIRQRLKRAFETGHIKDLLTELKKKDPEYYGEVDKNNQKRILRALEVIRQTSKKYSDLRNPDLRQREFRILKIGLDMERDLLYKRINNRMDNMISRGLFEEAGKLYPFKELNSLQTVGYQEIFNHIDGQYDIEETVRLLKRNSRRYAKRQLTWFKKDQDIKWFQPDAYDQILNVVNEFIATT